MHHGKKTGQGGLEFFNKSISTRAAKHLSMEADLNKALERGEFFLDYQPRLGLEDLRVEAVEALLRWKHPQRGLVAPDEFIPLAEQNGLIGEIGDWVLREACAQVRRWRDAGAPRWQVAVNVSGVQFRDGTLASRVSRAVEAAGIESRMIELEFTEGALIEYSAAVNKAVKSLKELGVATALDDFGTGYSSLSYLRHFPIDTLKIDRDSCATSSRRAAAMRRWSTPSSPWRRAWDWPRWRRASKPKPSGNTSRPATRIRFKASCSAGRWRSRIWNVGTPTGCTPASWPPRVWHRPQAPRASPKAARTGGRSRRIITRTGSMVWFAARPLRCPIRRGPEPGPARTGGRTGDSDI